MSASSCLSVVTAAGPNKMSAATAFDKWCKDNVKPPFSWSAYDCQQVFGYFEENEVVLESRVEVFMKCMARYSNAVVSCSDICAVTSWITNVCVRENIVRKMCPLCGDPQNKPMVLEMFADNQAVKSNVEGYTFGGRKGYGEMDLLGYELDDDDSDDDNGGPSGGFNQGSADSAPIVAQGPGGEAWAAFWEAQRTSMQTGNQQAATEARFETPEATVNFCKFGSNTGVAASLRGMASNFKSVKFIHDKLSSLTWTTRFGRIKNGILYYFADDMPQRGCLGCISLVGATVKDPIKQNGNVWTFDLTSPQPRKPGEVAPSSWTMGGASQEEATSVLDTIKKFF